MRRHADECTSVPKSGSAVMLLPLVCGADKFEWKFKFRIGCIVEPQLLCSDACVGYLRYAVPASRQHFLIQLANGWKAAA